MIKFDSNNIIVGYIKQFLHSFHLPNVKIYDENIPCQPNLLYLKDDYITKYTEEGTFENIILYNYNQHITNYTKTLKINNLLYDSHTHKYLGEYLRFLRDYHKVDLMSLYNCFTNEIPKNIYRKISYNIVDDSKPGGKVEKISIIDSSDSNYKLFMIPIKFDREYTIAIDSDFPYEMFCAYYGNGYYEHTNDTIVESTYTRITSSSFKNSILFNKHKTQDYKKYYNKEKDLKLFIKLPFNNNSSITILEGNYLKANAFTFAKDLVPQQFLTANDSELKTNDNKYFKTLGKSAQLDPYRIQYNRYKCNYKKIIDDEEVYNDNLNDINLITKNQLLYMNTNVSYPFADRLIEYLTDNVITKTEEVSDNIKRVQKHIINSSKNISNDLCARTLTYPGFWEDGYKTFFYDLAAKTNLIDEAFDILGYVDKDIESKLPSVSGLELDPNIYGSEV